MTDCKEVKPVKHTLNGLNTMREFIQEEWLKETFLGRITYGMGTTKLR